MKTKFTGMGSEAEFLLSCLLLVALFCVCRQENDLSPSINDFPIKSNDPGAALLPNLRVESAGLGSGNVSEKAVSFQAVLKIGAPSTAFGGN
jgi:hypothetical protein